MRIHGNRVRQAKIGSQGLSFHYLNGYVDWLTERALEHDKLTLLFHMICERLKQHQLIRPAVTTVERWVVTARMQAHQESLNRLQPLLTPERMTLLDSLLISESEQGPS